LTQKNEYKLQILNYIQIISRKDYNIEGRATYINSNISYSTVNRVEEETHNEICGKMIKK